MRPTLLPLAAAFALSAGAACDEGTLKDLFGDVALDASDTASDVGTADTTADAVDDTTDTAILDAADVSPDVEDPNALHVVYDLEGTEFLSTPWPSDHRLRSDGTPDLSTFPGANQGIMVTFRAAIEGTIEGFSTMPVVYVVFEDDIAAYTLPEPSTTLRPGSTVQLIDVSEEGCGARVPLVLDVDIEGDRYRPVNTLSARPVAGFTLRERTPYALVVREEFGLEAGRSVARPAALDAALNGSGDAALSASLAPYIACAAADETVPFDAAAVVTVFTTQDATGELQRLRDFVVDPENVPTPEVSELTPDEALSEEGLMRVWRGTFETPIFQEGVSPYTTGGAFAYTEDGTPDIQRWEEVPFLLATPDGEGPYPVLVWIDGTGATLRRTPYGRPARQALEAGFAIASFAPQFHDVRAVPGSDPVVHGFNYLNPVSGRTVFRQQVLDTSYFVRVLREGLAGRDIAAALDTDQLMYGGHSQGGIVGAFVAGVESEFDAYMLNGTGSYMSVTVIQRVDPIDIPALIEEFFNVGRRVDLTHPLIAIVQLGTDVVDPHNYAMHWAGGPRDPDGAHVFVVNGYNDTTTFPRSMVAMTIGGDLDVVAPAGWEVDPYEVWDRPSELATPFSGNREAYDGSPLTMGSFLDFEGNHFTVRNNERARDMAIGFWTSALDGVPVLE